MFKPFYIHEHHQPGKLTGRTPRGFTLKVSPDPLDHHNIIVSGAWCSNKDEFNKKTGRSQADIAEQKTINKRTLPGLVAQMQNVMHGYPNHLPRDNYYLLKYVI